MAEKQDKESTDGWRDMITQWEKGINSLANTTMASDEFSSTANGSMSLALRAQQAMGAAMATYLATLNLPSRADVTAISDRLAGIEAAMERIALALQSQHPGSPQSPQRARVPKPAKRAKPRRTKRPPSPPEST